MDRHDGAWNQAGAGRSTGRFGFAAVAGDRAAEVMAAGARWETVRRPHPVPARASHAGPARRWLGALLVGMGVRLQGLAGEVAPRSARSSEAIAR